jgi:hypothetical protein
MGINMEMSKGKKERLADRFKKDFPFKLTKDDITWLLCRAWPTSLGRIETNKDTIVEGGWGPLNYVLLFDPKLQDFQTRILERGQSTYWMAIVSGSEVIDLTELNTTECSAGDSFMMLV